MLTKRKDRILKWLGWDGLNSRYNQEVYSVYTSYQLNLKEWITSVAIGISIIFLVTYSFYQSWQLCLVVMPLSLIAPKFRRKVLLRKRRERLKLQFKDLLVSLVSSLAAGRSLESAFLVAEQDMQYMYPNMSLDIISELKIIGHRLHNGEPLEASLQHFANRAEIEEITQFVEALQTCKRTGGDLLAVMRRTANIISDQITIDSEIKVLIAQKQMESKMMMVTPFAFMEFLNVVAGDYMAPLYEGFGYILISIALLLLFVCFWFMHKVTKISL